MKNKSDFWATTKNIPHLYLYTKLIGCCFSFVGLNFLIMFLYLKFINQNKFDILLLFLGILMLILTPVVVTDPRKENRNILYVVFSFFFFSLCTVSTAIMFNFLWILIVFLFEIVFIAILIMKFRIKNLKKTQKKKDSGNGSEKKTGDGSLS